MIKGMKFNKLNRPRVEEHQAQCVGFVWQGFGSREAAGLASVRSCWKLLLCLVEPVPAGSKIDPLLAKDEPISKGSNASGTTYLRRGRTCCGTAIEREE